MNNHVTVHYIRRRNEGRESLETDNSLKGLEKHVYILGLSSYRYMYAAFPHDFSSILGVHVCMYTLSRVCTCMAVNKHTWQLYNKQPHVYKEMCYFTLLSVLQAHERICHYSQHFLHALEITQPLHLPACLFNGKPLIFASSSTYGVSKKNHL